MRFEHGQIRRAICALEVDLDGLRREPLHGQLTRLRADLYTLDALIRAHIERENAILIPALEPDTEPTEPTASAVESAAK